MKEVFGYWWLKGWLFLSALLIWRSRHYQKAIIKMTNHRRSLEKTPFSFTHLLFMASKETGVRWKAKNWAPPFHIKTLIFLAPNLQEHCANRVYIKANIGLQPRFLLFLFFVFFLFSLWGFVVGLNGEWWHLRNWYNIWGLFDNCSSISSIYSSVL